jgi:hypothetical protein
MDIPHPFRAVLAARPNSGKTCVIFNIILRGAQSQNPFEKIIVVHCDPEETKEYSPIDCTLLAKIPSPEQFSGKQKSLVILEDLNYHAMGKDQKGNLDRLFGYVSTHKNCSVIVTAQNPFSVSANVRRCANLFVLWSSHDMDSLALWIDLTVNTPATLPKNCYEKILLPS